ncbi:MAG: hypothetical protein AAGN66_07635 [Acidobacteriota bacterium]
MHRSSLSPPPVTAAVFACLLLGAVAASAQTYIYPAKYVCGYRPGNVTLLNDPQPNLDHYEDVKPGNYATTVNIVNLDLSDQVVFRYVVWDDDPGSPYPLPAQGLGPFQAAETSCSEIRGALPPDAPLGVIKGYVVLLTISDCFRVNDIFTFESQNAFERHVVWGFNPFDRFANIFEERSQTIPELVTPLPNFVQPLQWQFATSSGAGGLGLGASIDVEVVEPKKSEKPIDVYRELFGG